MNNQQIKTIYMSEKSKKYLRTQNTMLKIENVIKTCLLMAIPVGVVVLIVLDWLRVFRLSWLF